ncbi:MAG: hypothetical protein ACMUJM_24780 [bacterium]
MRVKIKNLPYLLWCLFLFLSLGLVLIHMGGCGGSGSGGGGGGTGSGESSIPDKEDNVIFEESQDPRFVNGEETYEFARVTKAADMHYDTTTSDGKITFPCTHFDESIQEVEVELKDADGNPVGDAEIIMMASDGEIIFMVRPHSDEYLPDFTRIKKTDFSNGQLNRSLYEERALLATAGTINDEIVKVIIEVSDSYTGLEAGKALVRQGENPPDFSEWERSYAVGYSEGQVCRTTMVGTLDHLCDIYTLPSALNHGIFAKITRVKKFDRISRIHIMYSIVIKGGQEEGAQVTGETALNETVCSAFAKIFDFEGLDPYKNYQVNFYTGGAPYGIGSEFPFALEIIELGVEETLQIEITSPTPEMSMSTRIIQLEGSVSDPNSENVIISHNGIETLINADSGSFSNPLVLESDLNLIWVGVRNEYGAIVGLDEIMLTNAASPSADDVTITLTWDKNYTDLDLYIIEPSGEAAYFYHANNDLPIYSDGTSTTQSGASIDIENIEGYGPENYYINSSEDDTILEGDYTIRVHHYFDYYFGDRNTQRSGEGTPVNFKVIVITDTNFRREYNGTLNYFDADNWKPSDTGPDWADIGQFDFKNDTCVARKSNR